ncbi:sulfonate transport system permease protein [Paenibacillus sp. V4I3]|uniref:ABC transporter permease n=1 Tax=unclassified Paenibacillus TaxID=185978 RepID=UPI002788B0F8|nr:MULTISPECIES: ABC transporter permease [unclassified Paenibacillus]MDQ0877701.1 sulfonate transport system permease protein [Paenibacillus sp. V4I3]MDQ0886424.1 sulfonate transport system permease protein [Paenibacillus sp. V4I9]
MNQAELAAGTGNSLVQQTSKEVPASPQVERNLKTNKTETKWQLIARGAVLPVTVLIIWQIFGSTGMISKTLLPTPIEIWLAFYDLLISGELFKHLKISIWRAAVGFLLGGSLGLIFGLLVGLFRRFEHSVDPTVQMLRTIPHLAITPLFILWFGFGEFSKVLLIAKGAFFPLYVQTFLGIRNVDSKLFDVARVLEFSKFKQITKLVLPAALPNILLGLRLSIGVAWLGLVVAEIMGSSEGVGYLIMDARQFSQTAVVFVGIMIFAFVGKGSDSLVRILEKKLLKWRDSFNG